MTGGLSVTGPVPDGPAIIVPNHQSHADAPALIAALPARSTPVMSAAADYWFSGFWRRTIVATAVSALPVYRKERGAYGALVDAARPHLEQGGIVIIFAEGTRAMDDEMGKFFTGPVRLASDLGVPLIPVALLGTRDVLPKNGRFRLRPIEVRFGPTFVPTLPIDRTAKSARFATEELREKIISMRGGPIKEVVSPVWREVAKVVDSPKGLALAFGWGYAEAISFPVMADMELAFLGAAVPRRTVGHSVAIGLGAAAGTATHVWLRRKGIRVPMPMTSPRMQDAAQVHLARRGLHSFWAQPFTGIPFKVYADAAASTNASIPKIVTASFLARGTRTIGFGLVAAGVSHALQKQSRRVWGRWMLASGAAWLYGGFQVRRFWL